jgi:hypothetical protein
MLMAGEVEWAASQVDGIAADLDKEALYRAGPDAPGHIRLSSF